MLYVDDITRASDNRDKAQYGNDKMEELLGPKSLQLNLTKSGYVVVGNKKARKELEKQLTTNPLTLCQEPMKEMKEMKFLGDYLRLDLEESVHTTVIKRSGIAKMAINDIRTVVEDTRASQLGGLNLAFTLWEAAIIPKLLWNSETWMCIQPKTIKILNNIFNQFYRSILRISTGCPKVNLYWQTGGYLPQNLVLKNKLNFLHHLSNLLESSLAKEVFRIQESLSSSSPSLLKELEEHLSNLPITSPEGLSKRLWKRQIDKYIYNKNVKDLIGMTTDSKKIKSEDLENDNFARKPYFSKLDIESARYRFRISSSLVHTIRGNFSDKYRKRNEPLTCPSCRNLNTNTTSSNNSFELPTDSMSHVMICPAFRDMRENLDTDNDRDLVEYFKGVVERRIRNSED